MPSERQNRQQPSQDNSDQAPELDISVFEAHRLYARGRSSETLAFVSSAAASADPRSRVQLELVRGMALFDQGDITRAIEHLTQVEFDSRPLDLETQFNAATSLFNRISEFVTPTETLPILSRLRQVAAAKADVRSLGGLHLAFAKLEACRGNYLSSRRHLETARSFVARTSLKDLKCSINLVDASLEVLGGNIPRALEAARSAYAESAVTSSRLHLAGSAGMLGLVLLLAGESTDGTEFLNQGLELAEEVLYMRLGILDNLLQVSLANDDLDQCHYYLRECAATISKVRAPSRSWYDLAHQVTRCSVLAHIGDWEEVLDIADDASQEAERRSFKALRTSLLCAGARALANLGQHGRAEGKLSAAVRACPRGAVDVLMTLETTTAICAAAKGEYLRASVHFDRALSTAKAVGNRLLEQQIDRDRLSNRAGPAGQLADSAGGPLPLASRERSLVLSDAATMLGAGSSITLLAQRAVALIQGTPMADRLSVQSFSGEKFRPEASVATRSTSDGTVQVEIKGSDQRIVMAFDDVESLEDVRLVKSLVDLLQAAVRQRSDSDIPHEGRSLWPSASLTTDNDAIFSSTRMLEIVRVALRLATSKLPVLISGETGTGKDILGRLIHSNSQMRTGPYVPFNCSSIPRDLVESQLFGHRKGAFTGAIEASQGVIRSAAGGSLFLDEVGDLDLALQPRLLRFIESGEIHAVGDGYPTKVQVRIIAATNANLDDMARSGRFRLDLLFRLGAAQIILPPLRERKDEIPALTASFINRFSREAGRPRLRVSDDLIAALLLYDWPGNIRQLANELQRIVAMAEPGQTLTSADLSPAITEGWILTPKTGGPGANTMQVSLDQPLPQAIEELERAFVGRAMLASGGHVAEAAQLLGISRKGLFLKRRRWGHLDPETDE